VELATVALSSPFCFAIKP